MLRKLMMSGNSALFMRDDQVEISWELMMPILEYWNTHPLPEDALYDPGSWGPQAAFDLLQQNADTWLGPA